ncbi:MAG: CBS domain-containing protein [Bacteriovorax sp.]|jgi:CBS domain-containing protein
MLVKECMTSHVELGDPEMTLLKAAQKMRDGDFGILPIQENDRLVGMLTDRDLVIRGMAEGKDPQKAKVRDVMTESVLYCFEDQTLEEVAENLAENQIRRLPVLNRKKRLVGILSLGDLAESLEKPDNIEETLTQICKPTCAPESVVQ